MQRIEGAGSVHNREQNTEDVCGRSLPTFSILLQLRVPSTRSSVTYIQGGSSHNVIKKTPKQDGSVDKRACCQSRWLGHIWDSRRRKSQARRVVFLKIIEATSRWSCAPVSSRLQWSRSQTWLWRQVHLNTSVFLPSIPSSSTAPKSHQRVLLIFLRPDLERCTHFFFFSSVFVPQTQAGPQVCFKLRN